VAEASLKPTLSSATRVEGPLNNVRNNWFVLVARLYNNLLGILHNPDRILKKVSAESRSHFEENLTQYTEFFWTNLNFLFKIKFDVFG
jgi:hypothetical protein